MLSKPAVRRDYDAARRGGATAARTRASSASSNKPSTATGARTPRANVPSRGAQVTHDSARQHTPVQPVREPGAFAQQRAQEAAWEYSGESGAAMARALRRQDKLRQEAAARARAALRQDKLPEPAKTPSNSDAPNKPSSSSSHPHTHATPAKGTPTPNDWRGPAAHSKYFEAGIFGRSGIGGGGLRFDWSKMEETMPFLKKLRQEGAGVRFFIFLSVVCLLTHMGTCSESRMHIRTLCVCMYI